MMDREIRYKLKELVGLKIRVYGIFDRFGTKTYKHHESKTLVLQDVRDRGGKILTDHLWFYCGKKFDKLKLKHGDQVRFEATVGTYMKGYGEYSHTDYTLKYPSQIIKMSHPLFQKKKENDEND
jgi:hypothetical protein